MHKTAREESVLIPRSVPLAAFARCISRAMDYISPRLSNHHNKVCRIALEIGRVYGFSDFDLLNAAVAALLHDAGGLSLKTRLEALDFNTDGASHAELGYQLLRGWKALSGPAVLVRGHHCRFDEWGESLPLGCHLLHLADRVDTLIDPERFILNQVPDITAKLVKHSGSMFSPDLVQAFLEAADKDYFWLETVSPDLDEILAQRIGELAEPNDFLLDLEELAGFSELVAHLIDFRSRFTATHSTGVAACARQLAGLCGLSLESCKLMLVAGNLHDLGKLAVPVEILEKPGKLSWSESNWMRTHSYYTGSILKVIPQLGTVTRWACLHHERPSGHGYPYQLEGEQLPRGARILAVSDVFTAIAENRPYREGMTPRDAAGVMRQMAGSGQLDPEVVEIMLANFESLDQTRVTAQAAASGKYSDFLSSCLAAP